MTPGTEVRLLLEPVVSRPRVMTLGRPHLVAVDLRLAGPVEDWPYDEEEFAFTCMLDASSGLSTVAVHDATVLVHRFGGSYGPAEFLVTPGEATGDHSLWLTILTPRGVVIHTSELPVRVRTESPDGPGTATRSILAPVPVLHRPAEPDRPEGGPRSDAADSSAQYVYIAIEAMDGTGDQVDDQIRLWRSTRNAFRAAGVSDGDYDTVNSGDGSALCILHPGSARSVPGFLLELRRAGIRLCVALDRGAEGPTRARPSVLLRLLDSYTLRAAEDLEGSVAVIVADGVFQDLIGEFRRLPPWTFRRAQISAPEEDVSRYAWFSVPSPEQLHSDLVKILADLFAQRTSVSSILEEIDFPRRGIPARWDPRNFWAQIVGDLARGPDGVAQLAETANRRRADNAELRRITKALRESEPPSYPVLTLVGSERHDDFLRLVRTRIDPAAELLYASPQQCAVLITEPEPSVEALQRATSGWGPDVRVEFQRYTFRPTALDSLRVRGTDGQIFELRGVPTTTPVRAISQAVIDEYPAPDESHDFALERTGPGGTPHRLDPDQMLHDAGILDGDELRLVLVARPNLFEDAVDRLVRSLRRPNTHLIVDGGDVAGLGYGDLPLNDQHARVLSGLRRLVRATGAEITCVFDGVELNAPVVLQAPRGVRVLFSRPGESARPLLQRLVQAEPAERAVVVVSSDPSVAWSASEGRVEFASSPLLLHWFTRAAGDIVRLFWLLDCSGSMALDGKIGALNDGMERTIADLREFAAEHSDLHMTARAITFSNGAQWHPQHPAPVDEFDWSPVTTGGSTDLGAALRLLSRELRGLSTLGRNPSVIIILVTDGLATDEWRAGLRELRNTPVGRDAVRGAVIIGDQADRLMVREFLDDSETEPRQADAPGQIPSAIRDVSLEAARAAWTHLSGTNPR